MRRKQKQNWKNESLNKRCQCQDNSTNKSTLMMRTSRSRKIIQQTRFFNFGFYNVQLILLFSYVLIDNSMASNQGINSPPLIRRLRRASSPQIKHTKNELYHSQDLPKIILRMKQTEENALVPPSRSKNLDTLETFETNKAIEPQDPPHKIIRTPKTPNSIQKEKELQLLLEDETMFQVQIIIATVSTVAGLVAFSFLVVLSRQLIKNFLEDDKIEHVPAGLDGVHRVSDICTSTQNCTCLSKFCPGISKMTGKNPYKPKSHYTAKLVSPQNTREEVMPKNSPNNLNSAYGIKTKVIPKSSSNAASKKDSCYSSNYQPSLNGCGYTTEDPDDGKSLPDLDNCLIISRHSFRQLPVESLLRKTSRTLSKTFSLTQKNSVLQVENYLKNLDFKKTPTQDSVVFPKSQPSSTSGIHSSSYPQVYSPEQNVKPAALPKKVSLVESTSSDEEDMVTKPRLLSLTKRRGVFQAGSTTSISDVSITGGSMHKRLSDGSIHDSDFVIKTHQKKSCNKMAATGRKGQVDLGNVGYYNGPEGINDQLEASRNYTVQNISLDDFM